MTPEAIEAKLTSIETTLSENRDELDEALNVRADVVRLREAVHELAEAMQMLGLWLQPMMNTGPSGEARGRCNTLITSALTKSSPHG